MCREAGERTPFRLPVSAAAVLLVSQPALLVAAAVLILAAWQVHPSALAAMPAVAPSVSRE
jgi:hypothetical protein